MSQLRLFCFCFILLLYSQHIKTTSDHIVINGAKLSLEVRTSGLNTIINGITTNYIKSSDSFVLNSDLITITCSKLNRIYTGSLYAYVNDKLANKTVCLEYDYNPLHSDDDSRFCLKQQFVYLIDSNNRWTNFEFICRFSDTFDQTDRVSLTLFRLYDDGLPRIRSGLRLDDVNDLIKHSVNREKLSCEAIKYSNQSNKFNALQWLTADMNKTIGFNTHSSQIAKSLFNYTSLFPYQSPLIKNNTVYKCCTILNGVIQQCQQFQAYFDSKNESTQLNLQYTTKKTILIKETSTTIITTPSESSTAQTFTSTSTVESTTSKIIQTSTKITTETTIITTTSTTSTRLNLNSLLLIANKNVKLSSSSNTSGVSNRNQLGNAEVGIIIACTGGVAVISLMFILGMLCYKRHRYGAIYLSKTQHKSQHTTTSSSQETISEVKSNSSNIDANNNNDSIQKNKHKKSIKESSIYDSGCDTKNEKIVSDFPCAEDCSPKKKDSKNQIYSSLPPPQPLAPAQLQPLQSTTTTFHPNNTNTTSVRPITNKKKLVDDLDYLNNVKLVRHESLYSSDTFKNNQEKPDINSSNRKIEQKIKTKETKKLTQRLLEPCPPCVEASILNAPTPPPPPPPPPLENIPEIKSELIDETSIIYASQPVQLIKAEVNQTLSASSFPPPPSSVYSFINEDLNTALTTIRVVNKTDQDNNQFTVLY